MSYVFAAEKLPDWEEDFLVNLSAQKLYLLLHSATNEQEQAVLTWLQSCLHASGMTVADGPWVTPACRVGVRFKA